MFNKFKKANEVTDGKAELKPDQQPEAQNSGEVPEAVKPETDNTAEMKQTPPEAPQANIEECKKFNFVFRLVDAKNCSQEVNIAAEAKDESAALIIAVASAKEKYPDMAEVHYTGKFKIIN